MDKLQKLIEDAEKATKGNWYLEDGMGCPTIRTDSTNIAFGATSGFGTPTSSYANMDHILNTQPSKILPILKAFRDMYSVLAVDHANSCDSHHGGGCDCKLEDRREKVLLQVQSAIESL